MNGEQKTWVIFTSLLAIVLTVLFVVIGITGYQGHVLDVGRERYYAQHCRIVRESFNNGTDNRDYICKEGK